MSIEQFKSQLVEWRHYLHQHPESAFEETNTAKFVAQRLEEIGLEVHRNIGKTGVVGLLKCGQNPEVIAIRADMDCLQMNEQTDLPYKSQIPNRMHACGHDGHITMGLGAAKLLAERKNFNGTVAFVFQPAEETGGGARAMLEDDIIERFNIKEIYGLHNMPGMKTGTISTRTGGIMGSEDNFIIRIKGKGSHAARPHMGRDPLVIAAEIILALQTIKSRNIDPSIPIVISCTEFHTDGVRNAIPSNVEIKGDTRSYAPDTQQLIEDRMRSICEHICAMNDAECKFIYSREFAPTVNWEKPVENALKAARNLLGSENVDDNVQPMMISEDFGYFLQKIPGCFVFLGNGTEEEGKGYLPLHNAGYDFNDDILTIGAEYFAELIKTRLPQ